ncbi:MAG: FAD-dependent thymidylate synthase [Clostridiales bacterium]|nr:FAD-dependent thymidylate synthase [Clostridiales bacterium]
MKVIKPYYVIEEDIDPEKIMKTIEKAGRTCYKSEASIKDGSAERFIASIIKRGHESVIEHEKLTVRFICDRGVSHEIVRHRVASYSQESTRYCNYSRDKFGRELTFIKPCFWQEDSPEYKLWAEAMEQTEKKYFEMTDLGVTPEQARSILPNSLKTEIVTTMNFREWRHFFRMRCDKAAHPQIREIALPLLSELKEKLPALFFDLEF